MTKPSVFTGSLSAVTFMAQRLPVALIPEQLLVSLVRNDVVNISCRLQDSTLLTLNAERMIHEEEKASLSPLGCIASLR